jgi:primosomal protein N' (replication factor Y) (superfamily II helicase)
MNDSSEAIEQVDSIRAFPPRKYADVALPVAVDKTFTYLIPPELEQAAEIGMRVLVPFGRKYTTGLVVALPTSTNLMRLKPIKDVLDVSPVVGEELLRLCFWIAEYYISPLGEVAKAAIPHGFSAGSKRIVRLSPSAPVSAAGDPEGRIRQRDKLLSVLAEEGPMLLADVKKKLRLPNINAVLNQLVKAGLVETEELFSKSRHRSASREFILLNEVDDLRLSTAFNALSPRKKRGKRLLNAIQFLKSQGVKETSPGHLRKHSKNSPRRGSCAPFDARFQVNRSMARKIRRLPLRSTVHRFMR